MEVDDPKFTYENYKGKEDFHTATTKSFETDMLLNVKSHAIESSTQIPNYSVQNVTSKLTDDCGSDQNSNYSEPQKTDLGKYGGEGQNSNENGDRNANQEDAYAHYCDIQDKISHMQLMEN